MRSAGANWRRLGEWHASAEYLPYLISKVYKTHGSELSAGGDALQFLGVVADLGQPKEWRVATPDSPTTCSKVRPLAAATLSRSTVRSFGSKVAFCAHRTAAS